MYLLSVKNVYTGNLFQVLSISHGVFSHFMFEIEFMFSLGECFCWYHRPTQLHEGPNVFCSPQHQHQYKHFNVIRQVDVSAFCPSCCSICEYGQEI